VSLLLTASDIVYHSMEQRAKLNAKIKENDLYKTTFIFYLHIVIYALLLALTIILLFLRTVGIDFEYLGTLKDLLYKTTLTFIISVFISAIIFGYEQVLKSKITKASPEQNMIQWQLLSSVMVLIIYTCVSLYEKELAVFLKGETSFKHNRRKREFKILFIIAILLLSPCIVAIQKSLLSKLDTKYSSYNENWRKLKYVLISLFAINTLVGGDN